MFHGKKKAVTFSFDDGVTQDIRAIEILNKYGLKATFNLNSALLGLGGYLDRNGKRVSHSKVYAGDVKAVYAGHEIACHTLTHPNLVELDEKTIVWQVEEDRKILSDISGQEVVGMAYPCGGVNNDDRVAEIIGRETGVKYSRTTSSDHGFSRQSNLLRFNPTVYYIDTDKMFELAEKFLESDFEEDGLLYVWGHTYEMDAGYISWERFEEFCKLISGKKDVFYGTNKEVLLQKESGLRPTSIKNM